MGLFNQATDQGKAHIDSKQKAEEMTMPDQEFESDACSKGSMSDSGSDSESGNSTRVTRQNLATVDPLRKVRKGTIEEKG